MPIHVQINLKDIRRPADIGVMRASVFLGLATNAAAAEPPPAVELPESLDRED